MEQYCYKCSEYASICVHMADERDVEYRVVKASKEFLESIEKIASIAEYYQKKAIMKGIEIMKEQARKALLRKYCTYHKFYNAWDL